MRLSLFALSLLAAAAAGCAPRGDGPAAGAPGRPAAPAGGTVGLRSGDAPGMKLDENSGLENYLAHAALRNPGLEAAFYRWQAALAALSACSCSSAASCR